MKATDGVLFRHGVPSLLGLCAVLTAANWSIAPERIGAWLAAGLLIAGLAIVERLAAPRPAASGPRRDAADIRTGLVFAASIMAAALAATLAHALGAVGDPMLARRMPMVVGGAYLVVAGNAIPKRLTPLSSLRCDPATAQAVQRVAGWTWVLSGLTVAGVWLTAPPPVAQPMSVAAILGGVLVVVAKIVSVRWLRATGA